MKVVAANDNLVVVDLEENKKTFAEQVHNRIRTDNGFYAPSILRIFPNYIEVITTGFDRHGSIRKRRKRIYLRDMLIMNDTLCKIMGMDRGRGVRSPRQPHKLKTDGSNPSLCTNIGTGARGEFQKFFKDLFGERCETYDEGCPNCDAWAKLNEARKDFVKDFTDEDFFTLVQYGLEDDDKLTPDAIKLKNEILIRWAKQSAPAFLHWFGEEKK